MRRVPCFRSPSTSIFMFCRAACQGAIGAALLALAAYSIEQPARAQAPETTAAGEPATASALPYQFRSGLALSGRGGGRQGGAGVRGRGRGFRSAVRQDRVELALVTGAFTAPQPGDTVVMAEDQESTWEAIAAGDDGNFTGRGLFGGYVYFEYEAAESGVVILEAAGHGMVYVNGEPRIGDPYSWGITKLPVALVQGKNRFLFQGGRGSLSARLVAPKAPVYLETVDPTLPDVIVGEADPLWGAVVVVNASDAPLAGLVLEASRDGGEALRTPVGPIVSRTVRKVAFQIPGGASAGAPESKLEVRLVRGEEPPVDRFERALAVRTAGEMHNRTYVSQIDGSVQYYAVVPAKPLSADAPPPAMVLSLHGASVEASGQAAAYSQKTWLTLVAPTNRRPYGFDWEDWGRIDAIEALEHAQARFPYDPQRVYLTGHSMGGHGTWHLGVTFPDRFAAIAPSAGWISFFSYGGGRRFDNANAVETLLTRASGGSDTMRHSRNYLQHGIYVIHGDADDNVPVTQAREMRDHLAPFHRDLAYHEEPAAGHWWDSSDEAGADCVDWAPMFDFFSRRAIPRRETIRNLEFVTANPGVSARCHWATIEAQRVPLEQSGFSLRYDPGQRRIVGTTLNTTSLALDLQHVPPGAPLTFEIDEQKWTADLPADGKLRLVRTDTVRTDAEWSTTTEPRSLALKGPVRAGPFKDAFRHRMVFVIGTAGDEDENAWALAKARYDAEVFWYRGNGSVEIVADRDFDASAEPDRGVVLYGNADTNRAWSALLAESPIQVDRKTVRIGERSIAGDDLACLFLRPRPGSDRACVAVVAGTGSVGLHLTDRAAYFVSGAAYPDYMVSSSRMLSEGTPGIRAIGYFAEDWRLDATHVAWQE